MITRKTAILFTTSLLAATGMTTAHAHSGADSGPLVSAIHSLLHAGGSELLAVAPALLATVWLVWRHRRLARR